MDFPLISFKLCFWLLKVNHKAANSSSTLLILYIGKGRQLIAALLNSVVQYI